MHSFNESHPAFSGFTRYYADEIFPQLAAWEGRRKNKNFWAIPALIVAVLFTAGISWLAFTKITNTHLQTALIVIAAMVPAATYRYFFQDFQAQVKDFIVGKVCGFTGLEFKRQSVLVPPLELFRTYGLFPKNFSFARAEDHIQGSTQGISFQTTEIHGKQGKSPYIATVFKFSLPAFAHDRIAVLRKGDKKPNSSTGLKHVSYAAPPFSDLLDVYGCDQVMSRYLLHPVFLERILYAEKVIDGVNARFAFDGQVLWVAVETANRFEQGSMWTSFVNPKRTQFLVWEVSSVLHVVDALVGLLKKPGRSV